MKLTKKQLKSMIRETIREEMGETTDLQEASYHLSHYAQNFNKYIQKDWGQKDLSSLTPTEKKQFHADVRFYGARILDNLAQICLIFGTTSGEEKYAQIAKELESLGDKLY